MGFGEWIRMYWRGPDLVILINMPPRYHANKAYSMVYKLNGVPLQT